MTREFLFKILPLLALPSVVYTFGIAGDLSRRPDAQLWFGMPTNWAIYGEIKRRALAGDRVAIAFRWYNFALIAVFLGLFFWPRG